MFLMLLSKAIGALAGFTVRKSNIYGVKHLVKYPLVTHDVLCEETASTLRHLSSRCHLPLRPLLRLRTLDSDLALYISVAVSRNSSDLNKRDVYFLVHVKVRKAMQGCCDTTGSGIQVPSTLVLPVLNMWLPRPGCRQLLARNLLSAFLPASFSNASHKVTSRRLINANLRHLILLATKRIGNNRLYSGCHRPIQDSLLRKPWGTTTSTASSPCHGVDTSRRSCTQTSFLRSGFKFSN